MRHQVTALLIATLTGLSPSLASASGSVPGPPPSSSRQAVDRVNVATQTARTARTAQDSATKSLQTTVAAEPYNLGKALFAGKYKLGNPQLAADNVAEKKQRLMTLRRTLPGGEREQLDAVEWSKRLTNREMNALEYYLGMRFGKFISKAPSWAKSEPPPQVALAR